MTSGERCTNITVICRMNSFDIYLPPMVIFPRERMAESLMTGTSCEWPRDRALDFQLREPGLESLAALIKTLVKCFRSTLLKFTQLYK